MRRAHRITRIMTNFALAHHFSHIGPTSKRFRTVVLPWKDVPVAGSVSPVLVAGATRRWTMVSALAASAVALHATLVWYVVHRAESTHAVRRKQELAVQILVPPPPPPPPKVVDPPKPIPPRPVRRQVLPQIKAAAPDEPQTDAAPSEPLLAVAPTAPEPALPPASPPQPEIVTAPFGRAGYLNNPPPNYPAAAARKVGKARCYYVSGS